MSLMSELFQDAKRGGLTLNDRFPRRCRLSTTATTRRGCCASAAPSRPRPTGTSAGPTSRRSSTRKAAAALIPETDGLDREAISEHSVIADTTVSALWMKPLATATDHKSQPPDHKRSCKALPSRTLRIAAILLFVRHEKEPRHDLSVTTGVTRDPRLCPVEA